MDESTEYPFDTVVYITDTQGGESAQASGVLIAPDEVLTASHVVYSSVYGPATNINVSPGYNAGESPFGSAAGTSIHYFDVQDAHDSISNDQSQYDYAVIHLSQSFAGLGTMGLEAAFEGGNAIVSGYPGYLNGAIENSQEYFSVNPTYTLLDGSSIGVGSSGGPVWVTGSNGEPYVVGLVSSGDGGVGSAGYFVQITTAALDQIDAWLAEDNGAAPAPVPAPVSTPPPIPTETVIAVDGTHSQYEIARDPTTGNVTVADTVASRDGTQTVHALSDISFTDGTGVIDPTGNAEETARLYQAALDRAPDLTGLDEWTAALNAGTLNIDGVALAFISSPEFQAKYGALDNTAFVVQLYQNVLHRSPDPTGEQGWVNQLNNGMSRAQALVGFSDSLENELDTQGTIGDPDIAEVYRLYQTAFDRPPDSTGLATWTQQLESGATPLQVAQAFVASAEFSQLFAGLGPQGFVDRLYQNALHRAADPAGEQSWIAQLSGGASQAQVLLGFSDSIESRLDTSQATHDGWVYIPAATA